MGSASETSSMMQNLLSNPQMLQSALQANPMASQYLTPQQRQMLNNPAMMQQVSQLMQNPQMMQEMQRMMESSGGMPGAGDLQRMQQMMRNMQPPTQPQQPNTSQQQQQPNASQQQQQQGEDGMTEEEMIAEAIARSLRES